MQRAAIYFDDDLRAGANAAGRNYWPVYTREICGQMGLPFDELPRGRLRAEELDRYRVLFLPDLEPGYLRADESQALQAWVEAGGLLVGFATRGLDDLFGVTLAEKLPQAPDDFAIVAALRYCDAELSRPLLPPDEADAPIPIVAPVQVIACHEGRELARLIELQGRDLRRPAITLREVGEGQALYFCFDVAHSVWAMHQGRPIVDDFDGDGMLRMSDAMVLRPFSTGLPYADLLVFLLRDAIARRGLAFLAPLPPMADGTIPGALFHYGGDDEHQPEFQVRASDTMKSLGLPYHVNIMPMPDGSFALSRAEFDHIRANGHEPALHFNFIDGFEHPYAFTREDIQRQVDLYAAAFGEIPVSTVMHYTTWCGWAEPAEWMAGAGILGDNSRFTTYCPPANPINQVGFGFGTAFPFFHYQDWRKGNDRIRFLGLPIGGYEAGYLGEEVDIRVLQRAIDLARFWRLPLDLFYHPMYVATFPACAEALRQGLEYIERIGLKALHYGPDQVTKWWLARSEAELEETDDGYRVECAWESGCIVRWACPGEAPQVTVDGAAGITSVCEEHGLRWLYVAVPAGRHEVQVVT